MRFPRLLTGFPVGREEPLVNECAEEKIERF